MGEPTDLPLAPAVNLRGSGLAFLEAAERALGVALPTSANRFHEADGRTAIWLGPDEWLVLCEATMEAHLRLLLDGIASAITDVTGNRVTFRLTGPRAHDLLTAGCSLDFHPRVFGPGHCAQTLLARTGVILLQRNAAPTFDLLVRRSFSRYLVGWLSSVAAVAGRS